MSQSQPVFDTSAGLVEIEFGINRWVFVSIGSQQAQEQIDSARQLADCLRRRGLPDREATDVAKSAWKTRPSDATVSSASADEGLLASTGLGSGTLLLIIVLFVLFWVFVTLYAIYHWPR